MTLWNTFVNSTLDMNIPWKIYDKHSRRLLYKDYGSLPSFVGGKTLDEAEVYKAEVKTTKKGFKYVRVSIITK